MNQCEYEILEYDDYAYIKPRYFIRVCINKHYCLQMEISEGQYNDILEEEKQNEIEKTKSNEK